MIGEYLKIAEDLKPDGFILENVESILHPANIETSNSIQSFISKIGYNCLLFKANAIEFGVPQKRKRVFYIASKKRIDTDPIKTHFVENYDTNAQMLLPAESSINWIAKYDKSNYYEKEEESIGKTYHEEIMSVPPGKNYISLTKKSGHPNPKFIANKRFWSFLLKLHPLKPSWTIPPTRTLGWSFSLDG